MTTTMFITLAVLAALWVAAVIWLVDEVTFDYTPDYLNNDEDEV